MYSFHPSTSCPISFILLSQCSTPWTPPLDAPPCWSLHILCPIPLILLHPTNAGKGFITQKQMAPSRTLAGLEIDLAVFSSIDKESTGRVTFSQVLHFFYPNLTRQTLEACIKEYTPDKLAQYRDDFEGVSASPTQCARVRLLQAVGPALHV